MLRKIIIVFSFLSFLMAALTAHADEIWLKNGKHFDGKVLKQDESSVVVSVEGGTVVFRADEVLKIVPKEVSGEEQVSSQAVPASTSKARSAKTEKTPFALHSVECKIRNFLSSFHNKVMYHLREMPWFYRWNQKPVVRQFRNDYPKLYYLLIYLVLIVCLLIVGRILVGIIKWILGFFFPGLRS